MLKIDGGKLARYDSLTWPGGGDDNICFLCQSLVNLRPRRPSRVEVRETDLSGSVDTVLHHRPDIKQRSKSAISVERTLDTDMVVVGIFYLLSHVG